MEMENCTFCDISKRISTQTIVQCIFVIECIVGLLSFIPNILILILLWRVKIFHANLRLILANQNFNLIVYSLYQTTKAFYRIFADPYTFPMLAQPCILRELLLLFPSHNGMITLIILGLERLYATIRYRSYDFSNPIPILAIFLLPCGWALTLFLNIPHYLNAPSDVLMAICEIAIAMPPVAVVKAVAILLCLELLAITITAFVFFYNRYKLGHMAINQATYNLSSRFQINQNIQVNAALMPGMILHVICYIPTFVFLSLLFILGNGLTLETRLPLLQLTYLWRQVYALVDPILLIILNKTLKEHVKKTNIGRCFAKILDKFSMINRRKIQSRVGFGKDQGRKHFEILEQAWAIPKGRKHEK